MIELSLATLPPPLTPIPSLVFRSPGLTARLTSPLNGNLSVTDEECRMAGNSTDPGRSVTSKVTAILMVFADGDVHSLTENAAYADLPTSTAPPGLRTGCLAPSRTHRGT